ncbi:hypothetical protein HPB49_006720 [Dermacentor silvarum]|uniref:Uncharacterized protein n=1 Tax=Dermacentor silvarum TaxID=543639 RepID=A0ACB8DI77_DERSI|nr:hypothetical protein HPB49_006720 [Dermacentor silvarum]
MPQETATSATLVAQAAQVTGTQKQNYDGTTEQESQTAIPISDPLQVQTQGGIATTRRKQIQKQCLAASVCLQFCFLSVFLFLLIESAYVCRLLSPAVVPEYVPFNGVSVGLAGFGAYTCVHRTYDEHGDHA